MSLRMALRRYSKWVGVILFIWAIATVCAVYILKQQRLSSPFTKSYEVKAEFDNLTGVAPGLGLPVNVAGVRVGQITGVKVVDGRGVATLRMDPKKLKHVYVDASATLIPNTLLKDMRINLRPGTPSKAVLGEDQVIRSSQTRVPIDIDELLAALDTDTRAWFTGLISDLGVGVKGRGGDLKALLHELGPTSEQVKKIGDLLAARRHTLPTLVHDLSTVTQAAGSRDKQLAQILTAGNRTLGALGQQDAALRTSITRLPKTLELAGSTLTKATGLTDELRPTLRALQPTARRLPQTLKDTNQLFQGGALLPLKQLRQFVDAAQPLTKLVPSAVQDLSTATPPLTDAFNVLRYTVNELAYNPGGGNQGFLYWLAWFSHNANSALSTGDALGSVVRGLAMGSCSTLASNGPVGDVLKVLIGSSSGCPGVGG